MRALASSMAEWLRERVHEAGARGIVLGLSGGIDSAVVEDRRSMLGAFLAGWRFVAGNPLKAGGLYLMNAAAFGALVWVCAFAIPAASDSGAAGFTGVLAAGLCLLARMALKLAFFASQTSLFQRSLAHADYTAAPQLLWPESPAAEEIVNAAATRPPQP